MVLGVKQYELANEFLDYLRTKNFQERTSIVLIPDKEERIEKLRQLEEDSKAINILTQLLNS